jgi:hypothetical protein
VSALADAARVAVVLTDYAAADVIGKVNIIGAGWAITGVNPESGAIAPQAVVVLVDVPPAFYGDDFTVGLQLKDSAGVIVQLPGPAGEPQAIRVAQILRVEEPAFPPGTHAPRGLLWSHSQVIFYLANGLPLRSNEMYTWALELDGEQRDTWGASFYVAGPPPAPVIG